MRIITILIFLFLFQASAALVNTAQAYDYSMVTADEWFTEVDTSSMKNKSYLQSSVEASDAVSFGFGDFIKAFGYFLGTFAVGIIWVPFTMTNLGIPLEIAFFFSLPVYMVYFLGIVQFIRGSPTTTMR